MADLHLIVIDTKTRFSPGEGLGNVSATQEIAYYEYVAQKTNATVMLLHHSSKLSRDGHQTGIQAYRDATALYDSVRAAWYIRALRADEAAAQGVADDGAKYMLLENSKNNYLPIMDDVVVKRMGFAFSHVTPSARLKGVEKKTIQENEQFDFVIGCMQTSSGSATVTNLVNLCKGTLSRAKMYKIVDQGVKDGLLEQVTRNGVQEYRLTNEGLNYNISVE
jgi:RecA-family ATPase